MWILTVAQLHLLVEDGGERGGPGFVRDRPFLHQVSRHHGVVARRVRERFRRELCAEHRAGRTGMHLELVHQRAIVGRIHDHGDGRVVLRCGAQHRRPADVDVLDRLLVAAIRARDGLRKRVEIDDEQVDGLDAVFAHHPFVDSPTAEEAAVDPRVQRLDTPAHDLREAGVGRDFACVDAVLGEEAGGAAGGQDLDAPACERARQLDESRLIGHAQQSAAYRRH
jgi:hypothetical protein